MGTCPPHARVLVNVVAITRHKLLQNDAGVKTVWPSGLRRWLKAPFRKGVGSNPTAVICRFNG